MTQFSRIVVKSVGADLVRSPRSNSSQAGTRRTDSHSSARPARAASCCWCIASPCRLARRLHRRSNSGDQHADDRNNNQEFHERKTT